MARSDTVKLTKHQSDPESFFANALDERLDTVKQGRFVPTLSLIGLLGLFIASGAGIAFQVLTFFRPLRLDDDLVSRALVFSASVVSLLYVIVHLRASRTHYTVTQTGPPWLYGNHLHTAALLGSRLAFAVWIAAIVTSSLLAAKIGIRLDATLPEQTIYLNLIICTVGL